MCSSWDSKNNVTVYDLAHQAKSLTKLHTLVHAIPTRPVITKIRKIDVEAMDAEMATQMMSSRLRGNQLNRHVITRTPHDHSLLQWGYGSKNLESRNEHCSRFVFAFDFSKVYRRCTLLPLRPGSQLPSHTMHGCSDAASRHTDQ